MHYDVNMLLVSFSFNYVLLFCFSYYDTKAVFLALGITAVVCIAVTVFCFQTKVWCGWVHALVLISFKRPQCINMPVGGFSLSPKGRLHQVPGPLLCPWHRNLCDWHHYSHCAVLQICE